jgi:hypothetical protein
MTTISILSLVIAALAVVIGPTVTWRVATRERAATLRQAWMRDFREEIAKLLSLQLSLTSFTQTYTNYPKFDLEQERIKGDLNNRMKPILLHYTLVDGRKRTRKRTIRRGGLGLYKAKEDGQRDN